MRYRYLIKMSPKERYIQWAQTTDLPLFVRPGWLNAVAPMWDVALVENDGAIIAALPYCYKKGIPGFRIYMPFLTPYIGPQIVYPEGQKYSNRISHQRNMVDELLAQLPEAASIEYRTDPTWTNGLSFQWAGLQQTVRYTHIIEDTADTEQVFSNFQDKLRGHIRKAGKHLQVRQAETIGLLYDMLQSSYASKGDKIPIEKSYVEGIWKAVQQNGWGTVLEAVNEEGEVQAAVLLVWDHKRCYYLMSAIDHTKKERGAKAMLIWEGIKMASAKGLAFDFEGSIVPDIQRFFNSFGGTLTPYYQFERTSSSVLKVWRSLK